MMRFTEEHEWISVEGEVAKVGITNHAQDTLGDITFVDLPKVGKVVKKGDSLCVVESVKAASDVFAPVGGTVVAVNTALSEAPETINQSAEKDGWICELGSFQAAELEGLMTPDQYAAWCKK